jgi:hypothetical protein
LLCASPVRACPLPVRVASLGGHCEPPLGDRKKDEIFTHLTPRCHTAAQTYAPIFSRSHSAQHRLPLARCLLALRGPPSLHRGQNILRRHLPCLERVVFSFPPLMPFLLVVFHHDVPEKRFFFYEKNSEWRQMHHLTEFTVSYKLLVAGVNMA